MNRLQKKCIIVTAGIHLLLAVILIVGPAFFSAKPKEDDLQVLDVIPANLIDAPFNSGVANAQPPPPVPEVTPPAPVPVVTPPAPVPPKVEPPKPAIKDPDRTPLPAVKPKPQISTQLVTHNVPKTPPNPNAAKAANDAARARAVRNALRKLKNNLTSATTVDMPGNSSVSYANYASVVRSIYDENWNLPDHIDNDEEITKASVTIASDGTVITARIVTPSGDASVDDSVQSVLERVKEIAPFPDGATDKERTYIINFNPKTKKMLE